MSITYLVPHDDMVCIEHGVYQREPIRPRQGIVVSKGGVDDLHPRVEQLDEILLSEIPQEPRVHDHDLFILDIRSIDDSSTEVRPILIKSQIIAFHKTLVVKHHDSSMSLGCVSEELGPIQSDVGVITRMEATAIVAVVIVESDIFHGDICPDKFHGRGSRCGGRVVGEETLTYD